MSYRNKVKKQSNKIIVSSQTLYHLHCLADQYEFKSLGAVVDKLVKYYVTRPKGGENCVHSERKSNRGR